MTAYNPRLQRHVLSAHPLSTRRMDRLNHPRNGGPMQPMWVRRVVEHAVAHRNLEALDSARHDLRANALDVCRLSHHQPQLNHRQSHLLAPRRRPPSNLADFHSDFSWKTACSNSSLLHLRPMDVLLKTRN